AIEPPAGRRWRGREGQGERGLDDVAGVNHPIAAGKNANGARGFERFGDEGSRHGGLEIGPVFFGLGKSLSERRQLRGLFLEPLEKLGLLGGVALARWRLEERGQ